jgi:hypothetical protein
MVVLIIGDRVRRWGIVGRDGIVILFAFRNGQAK